LSASSVSAAADPFLLVSSPQRRLFKLPTNADPSAFRVPLQLLDPLLQLQDLFDLLMSDLKCA
jgi:hypothetical protein